MAYYPNAIMGWTTRVDGEIVDSDAPNDLADELIAVQTAIGINPMIEPHPLHAAPSQFSSLSARVSQAMLQSGHPFIQVGGDQGHNIFQSNNAQSLQHMPCNNVIYDWDDYRSNGSIVIKDAGVWFIHALMSWPYVTGGWVTHCLMFDGDIRRRHVFDYDQFPSSGTNFYGERYINQLGWTETTYLGYVAAGTVVSIFVGNMCNHNPVSVQGAELSAYFLRP